MYQLIQFHIISTYHIAPATGCRFLICLCSTHILPLQGKLRPSGARCGRLVVLQKYLNEWNENMANTYTQIHIHAIFAVQNRLSLIQEHWKEELYKYISGIVTFSINQCNSYYYFFTRSITVTSGGVKNRSGGPQNPAPLLT